jgi:hypothetical protein
MQVECVRNGGQTAGVTTLTRYIKSMFPSTSSFHNPIMGDERYQTPFANLGP